MATLKRVVRDGEGKVLSTTKMTHVPEASVANLRSLGWAVDDGPTFVQPEKVEDEPVVAPEEAPEPTVEQAPRRRK